MRFPGFIGPAYTLQSVNADCQSCVNWFPEINHLGTEKEREVAALVPTPGLTLLLTLPTAPVRGLYRASTGTLYAVGGEYLYSVSSSWVATQLGLLGTSTGPVSMSDNGSDLVLVDGTNGYKYNFSGTTYAQITDSGFLPADQVTFLDGYFILNATGTQQFFFSAVNAVTFDPLDVESAEGSPDNLVGLIANSQNLFTFGSQSTEVFYDSGDALNPFARIQGAVINVGCSAPFSIARLLNDIYFIGGDDTGQGIVYRMTGYNPQRISTPAIEALIRDLDQTTLAEARGWVYQQGGHAIYCLNVPGSDKTQCYDASTGMWHEMAFNGTWGYERHRGDCSAVAYTANVVGDYSTGAIYKLDPTVYTDNGTAILRERTVPHFSNGLRRQFHRSIQIDCEVGVGLDGTAQGSDPLLMLTYSDDGGHTFGNERTATLGKIGQTKARAIIRRLGSARDRVYRVRISDPVKPVLLGAELMVEDGVA